MDAASGIFSSSFFFFSVRSVESVMAGEIEEASVVGVDDIEELSEEPGGDGEGERSEMGDIGSWDFEGVFTSGSTGRGVSDLLLVELCRSARRTAEVGSERAIDIVRLASFSEASEPDEGAARRKLLEAEREVENDLELDCSRSDVHCKRKPEVEPDADALGNEAHGEDLRHGLRVLIMPRPTSRAAISAQKRKALHNRPAQQSQLAVDR
jgi:hypothetical protein